MEHGRDACIDMMLTVMARHSLVLVKAMLVVSSISKACLRV